MSWSLNIGTRIPKAEFDAAVDAAVATGQEPDLPGMAEDVAAAKAALKELGARVKRPLVNAYAGGHCLQPGEVCFSDSISVNVSGSDATSSGI